LAHQRLEAADAESLFMSQANIDAAHPQQDLVRNIGSGSVSS
jgi:hypothetical protein